MKNNETSNPVVVCSNHTGRAENPSKSPTRGDTREHGNTRVGPWVAAQELHGGSGDPSPNPGAAEPSREHLGHAAVSEVPLPEALRGCADFARGFVEGARSATTPTPEQDRVVIRRALGVMREWDEWDGDICGSATLEGTIERLRDALTEAGYLDAEGGSNG